MDKMLLLPFFTPFLIFKSTLLNYVFWNFKDLVNAYILFRYSFVIIWNEIL